MCTSVDSYGSGSQTSRLPSVPEEEENQQHQYDRDNNNIFSKQVSTIGYFMITLKQTCYNSLRMRHRRNRKQELQSLVKQ